VGLCLGRIGIWGEKGEQFGVRETRRGRRAAESGAKSRGN
jgi:hypothetical protein